MTYENHGFLLVRGLAPSEDEKIGLKQGCILLYRYVCGDAKKGSQCIVAISLSFCAASPEG
jgi:hypothetical protein